MKVGRRLTYLFCPMFLMADCPALADVESVLSALPKGASIILQDGEPMIYDAGSAASVRHDKIVFFQPSETGNGRIAALRSMHGVYHLISEYDDPKGLLPGNSCSGGTEEGAGVYDVDPAYGFPVIVDRCFEGASAGSEYAVIRWTGTTFEPVLVIHSGSVQAPPLPHGQGKALQFSDRYGSVVFFRFRQGRASRADKEFPAYYDSELESDLALCSTSLLDSAGDDHGKMVAAGLQALFIHGRATEARSCCDLLLSRLERASPVDVRFVATLYGVLAMHELEEGRESVALAHFEKSAEAWLQAEPGRDETVGGRAYSNMAMAYAYQAKWPEALRCYEHVVASEGMFQRSGIRTQAEDAIPIMQALAKAAGSTEVRVK